MGFITYHFIIGNHFYEVSVHSIQQANQGPIQLKIYTY